MKGVVIGKGTYGLPAVGLDLGGATGTAADSPHGYSPVAFPSSLPCLVPPCAISEECAVTLFTADPIRACH